jgi:Glycosyltransferases involved in cell wall biogenesis
MEQTYRNLEIILVDDGSPDRCPEICDRLAKEDKRIFVIHQINSGVSAARNAGLRIMTGELLFFTDSDDIVMPTAIQTMLDIMLTQNADMVCAQCSIIDENGNTIKNEVRTSTVSIFTREEAMKRYALRGWAPWNRLMKAYIHQDILFPSYRIHEDEAIKFRLLWNCRRIAELDQTTYAYRQRRGSITADSSTPRIDMFYSREENYYWLEKNCPQILPYFIKSLWDGALYNIGVFCRVGNVSDIDFKNILKFVKKYARIIFSGKDVTISEKLRLALFINSNWKSTNNLYCRLYRAIRRM